MKIKELYQCLEEGMGKNKEYGNYEIEFWLNLVDGSIPCEIDSIGQFSSVPDMTIAIKPNDNKVYSTESLSKEEINYRNKYEKLKENVK